MFDGGEAIRRGMADRRGTLDEMIAEMAGRNIPGNAAPAAAAKEKPMDWASITLAALREHRADLVTGLESAAEAAGRTAGAAAERDRILALDEIAMSGHEALVAAAKKDGKTTAEGLALQILKADKAAGTSHLAGRAEGDAATAVTPVTPLKPAAKAADASLPIEARARAAWDASADLQAEFGGSFDAFLAFEKANAAGTARILRAAR
jgi:hypothetical protein